MIQVMEAMVEVRTG